MILRSEEVAMHSGVAKDRPKNRQISIHEMDLEIITVPVLNDNLSFVLYRLGSETAVVIDPSEADPLVHLLKELNLNVGLILNTHHHPDHVGGNLELQERYGADVVCSAIDLTRVPGATRGLADGEYVECADVRLQTISIPGHTRGQVAFHSERDNAVFVGDTLFSMGCGRLYEGTAAEMWRSLSRLKKLPPDERLYFGHEYTERNAVFAKSVALDPGAIDRRLASAREEMRRSGIAAAPTLQEEIEVNPFLRPLATRIAAVFGGDELATFTELRRLRDAY